MKVGRLFRRDAAIAEAVFEDQADGVAVLDTDGQVLRANPRFTALTGATEGEAAWATLPKQAAVLQTKLRDGRQDQITLSRTADGVRRSLRLVLLPIPPSGALLRVTDITRECDMEEQLGQAQRLQAVGELAGGIAHDFNNLLTAIIDATEDLQSRAGDVAEDVADLRMVRESADRGAALVRHLLAFSRQQTLQPQVLALNDAIRDTAALLRRLLGAGMQLELELEEPGRQVRIDPTQLGQVLTNLAVNARHAMPGGGRLRISTGHDLKLSAESLGGERVPPGRYARLSVADTGTGIPPDVLPRIFEPFFTTRREAGGTGLGLSTVHGIVRQSGGYMTVHSAPGEGTRFDILLPRHEESAIWQPAPPVAAHAARASRASRTLLLVDDEAPVRRLAERVLQRAGWQVVAATCAEDALELVDAGGLQNALACVISDVVMPGLDGPALVRVLREGQAGLPAILMSGYADASLRRDLQAADIRFLPKPFGMADLTEALRELLAA